jgi:hypothetical protein
MGKRLLFLTLILMSLPLLSEEIQVTNGVAIEPEGSIDSEVMEAMAVAAEFEAVRDHDSALDEYLSLVEVVADSYGEYSDQLLEPLAGLSRTYIAMGYAEEAGLSLRRAQHITHRNDGVYSPRQIEFIEMMADLALLTRAPMDADKQQKFMFFVSSHHFSGLDGIHAYTRLATWYTATGQHRKARRILEEVITMIETEAGENDLRLMEPLKLISQSRRLQGACCIERSLERATGILDQHSDVPGDIVADIYSELADANIIYGKTDIAASLYAASYAAERTVKTQAPKMISMSKKIGNSSHPRKQMFAMRQDTFSGYDRMRRMSLDEQLKAQYQPPQIFTVAIPEHNYGLRIKDTLTMPPSGERVERTEALVGTPFQFLSHQLQNILPNALRDEVQLASIFIELNFTVSEKGSVQNIEFRSSNAPVKLNRLMKEVIRKIKFRPGLVEGQPVITHNVMLTQSFEPI